MSRPIGIAGSDGLARHVAERIAATGQRVLAYAPNAVPDSRRAKNIEAAATLADLGFDCEIVLTFVDDSVALRTLLFGTPERLGLGAEMNPGSVLVDFGARPPREAQALLGVTGMRGIAIADAAIAGTADGLASASTTIFVGGYPDAVDIVEPVLALLGRVDRTGSLGSAHTAAALMGYMEAAHRIALAEALSVGNALGLSPETLSRVLNADPAAANADNLALLARHTGLALKLATDLGVSAEVIDFTGARLAQNALSRT